MKNILKLLVFLLLFTSCEDLFDPAKENIRKLEAMYKEPGYAQGILGNGYVALPYNSTPMSDLATDDAVTNSLSSAYLKMATGSWSSNYNPVSTWQGSLNAIQYMNIFLENADSVVWSTDANIRAMFNDRLKGEAYGLRAVHMYFLLRAHGGLADNQLMGVPILSKSLTPESDFNLPRNTFQECYDQLIADANKAIDLLPLDYVEVTNLSQVPAKYQAIPNLKPGDYDRVAGKHLKGRISGRIVEAVRAQAALLAASPAYLNTPAAWEAAANYADIVLDRIGGPVSGLAPKGLTWYVKEEVDNLTAGGNPAEMIWRGDVATNNGLETDNFPPSLFGRGRVNPTQNLVDAFPMVNGYPISDASSTYDAANPYANRDPRLATYILFNEGKQGPNDKVIVTGTYGTDKDAINREGNLSTRTGYYMRKLLRKDCNPDPAYNTQQKHYTARIRYTEIFLAYAEAANEAWGPMDDRLGYSAYQVIQAIRSRAGIGKSNGDSYLENIRTDKDKMRELIRNERRLELCFENNRFWDLRRWKVDLSKLNETAGGMQIDKTGATLNYSPINVEIRDYKAHMYYGPVPFEEMLKWSNLKQNAGW